MPDYTYCLDQVHIYLLDDQENQMNEHTILENLLEILIQIRHPTCNGNARSSHPEVFCKKGVYRNFTRFTGKPLCQSLFLTQVFSCEFCEIFKNTSLHRTPLVAASEMQINELQLTRELSEHLYTVKFLS